MTLDEKLLNMLSSNDPQVRYMALEQIQNSTTSSEKIVSALEKATHDEDKGTALRARVALQSDVHHQTANQMGIIVPEVNEEESQFILDQTTAKLPPGERPKLAFVGKTADEIPMPITVPWVLQISQAIAFVICVFGLIRYLLFPTGFRLSDYWILIPFSFSGD